MEGQILLLPQLVYASIIATYMTTTYLMMTLTIHAYQNAVKQEIFFFTIINA